jgi:uncharacterized repeat protein (TIGR04076 family)
VKRGIQYQRLIFVIGKHIGIELEMKPYKLVGHILRVKGDCTARHKVGEQFDLTLWAPEKDATKRAPSLCPFFYNMILPYLAVLQFGETFPWKGDKDSFQISCPDPANQVTLEIKRIKV